MKLTPRQVQIIEELYNLNLNLANGDENQRRQLTQKIAEQVNFEFGPRYGMKARAGGNISNASKDSLAYLEDDTTVSVWDWQNGTTRKPQVVPGMEPTHPHLPLNEAKFITVSPVNHLNTPDTNDGDEDDDNDDDYIQELTKALNEMNDNLKAIRTDNVRMLENQMAIMQAIQLILDKPTPPIEPHLVIFPEYEGQIGWSGKVTLKPKVK